VSVGPVSLVRSILSGKSPPLGCYSGMKRWALCHPGVPTPGANRPSESSSIRWRSDEGG
jgi:hypothetical protein